MKCEQKHIHVAQDLAVSRSTQKNHSETYENNDHVEFTYDDNISILLTVLTVL